MKTFSIEVTEETAQQMLPILERQRNGMASKLKELDVQIAGIRSKIGNTTFSDTNSLSLLPMVSKPEKTLSGKVKKGQSEPIIENFLKSSNGRGVTAKEIVENTGASVGTVYRILKIFKDSGKIDTRNERWYWAA